MLLQQASSYSEKPEGVFTRQFFQGWAHPLLPRAVSLDCAGLGKRGQRWARVEALRETSALSLPTSPTQLRWDFQCCIPPHFIHQHYERREGSVLPAANESLCRLQGAAADDGRLKRGDQILAVNGEALEGVTHEQAVAILKRQKGTVTLTVLSWMSLRLRR